MPYSPKNILIDDALALLKKRGVGDSHNELLLALREGSLVAWGLAAGPELRRKAIWREIPCTWWRHVNSGIQDNAAFFDRVETDPPTPWRVERIEIPRSSVDSLWKEASQIKPVRAVGRPPGSGSIAADKDLVQQALEMVQTGKATTAHDAARQLAARAAGYGTTDSKIHRLWRKIRDAQKAGAAQVGQKLEFRSNPITSKQIQ